MFVAGRLYEQEHIPYSQKFSRYIYFAVESLIRIFADKISRMAYNETSFQLKMMPSIEFPCAKFLLLIDHLRKPLKFHTVKFSGYTVYKYKCFKLLFWPLFRVIMVLTKKRSNDNLKHVHAYICSCSYSLPLTNMLACLTTKYICPCFYKSTWLTPDISP